MPLDKGVKFNFPVGEGSCRSAQFMTEQLLTSPMQTDQERNSDVSKGRTPELEASLLEVRNQKKNAKLPPKRKCASEVAPSLS